MAIDTEAKRRSALMLFGPSVFPDGTITETDRPAALWHYIGIAIDDPNPPGGVDVSPRTEDERLVRPAGKLA